MIRPDIKTYHEDRRLNWFSPDIHRRHFLGKSALEFRWQDKEPKANLSKKEQLFELEIALLGFSKEEIEVNLTDNILTVKAKKKKKEKISNAYILQEFDVDYLERKFTLAKDVELDEIEAAYKNGILTITFRDVRIDSDVAERQIAVN